MSHTLGPGLSLARRCTARGTAKLLPRQAAIVSALFHLKMTSRFVMHANPSSCYEIFFSRPCLTANGWRCSKNDVWAGGAAAKLSILPTGLFNKNDMNSCLNIEHWNPDSTHKPVADRTFGLRGSDIVFQSMPNTQSRFSSRTFSVRIFFSVLSIPHSFGRWLIRTFEAICTIARSCAT